VVRRSKDWNRGLAEDLRDPQFAREFLLAAIDDGISVQRALGKVVRAMGVKEFAAKVRMGTRTCCGQSTRATTRPRKR